MSLIDMSSADYREKLAAMSHDELVAETSTDEIYSLSEFVNNHG